MESSTQAQQDSDSDYDPFDSNFFSQSFKATIHQLEEEEPWQRDIVLKGVKINDEAVVCERYRLGEVIGAGGFGSVFLERDNHNLVVKTEYGALRSLEQFETEVRIQNLAA